MCFRHVSFYPYFGGHDSTHFMLIIAVITILINENIGEHASHFGGGQTIDCWFQQSGTSSYPLEFLTICRTVK